MVKTNRSTLHMLYNIQQSATQDSDYTHVAIVPTLPRRTATTTRLSCRTATTTRFSPKAARHRRRQGVANIRSSGLSPRKHSPDGATAHIRLNGPASHLSTSEG